MKSPLMISAEDRDLLYHRVIVHLAGIDTVWLAARQRDYAAADQSAREYCDELQL